MKARWFGVAAALAATLALWWICALMLGRSTLPLPGEVAASMFASPDLPRHVLISLRRVGLGILVATLAGFPLGIAAGRIRIVDRVLTPVLFLFYPVPKVVFLPLLILFLGLTDVPRVTVIALIVFFQIFLPVRDAAARINPAQAAVLHSLRAGPWDRFRHLLWPACLPDLLTALRVSTGTAIAVLFLVESFATSSGLGFLILESWGRLDYPLMYGAVVAMALVGVGLYLVLEAAEYLLCPWKHR